MNWVINANNLPIIDIKKEDLVGWLPRLLVLPVLFSFLVITLVVIGKKGPSAALNFNLGFSSLLLVLLSIGNWLKEDNDNETKDICDLSVITPLRTKQKGEKTDAGNWFKSFDSSKIFILLYLFTIIGIFVTKAKGSTLSFVILFVFSFVFQILSSVILKQFSNNKSFPSVFSYLDSFMENTDNPEYNWAFVMIGSLRLVFLFLLCFIVSGFNPFTADYTPQNIASFYGLLILVVTLWQILIGDGCIMDRTIKKYSNVTYSDLYKGFWNISKCSIQNQLGIHFNLLIFAWLLFNR
jgi:hypothetical protein